MKWYCCYYQHFVLAVQRRHLPKLTQDQLNSTLKVQILHTLQMINWDSRDYSSSYLIMMVTVCLRMNADGNNELCQTYSRESRLLSFSLPCHRLLMTTLCSEISCCFPDESRRACSSGLRSWLISFPRIIKSNLFPLRAAKSDNQVEKEQEVLDENGSNLRTIRNLWVWFINRTHVEVSVGVSWHPDFISQVGSGTSVQGITRGRGELPSIACWARAITHRVAWDDTKRLSQSHNYQLDLVELNCDCHTYWLGFGLLWSLPLEKVVLSVQSCGTPAVSLLPICSTLSNLSDLSKRSSAAVEWIIISCRTILCGCRRKLNRTCPALLLIATPQALLAHQPILVKPVSNVAAPIGI